MRLAEAGRAPGGALAARLQGWSRPCRGRACGALAVGAGLAGGALAARWPGWGWPAGVGGFQFRLFFLFPAQILWLLHSSDHGIETSWGRRNHALSGAKLCRRHAGMEPNLDYNALFLAVVFVCASISITSKMLFCDFGRAQTSPVKCVFCDFGRAQASLAKTHFTSNACALPKPQTKTNH